MSTALLWALVSAAAAGLAQDKPQEAPPDTPPRFEETVEIVAVTPIHGLGVPKSKVPANVQSFTVGQFGDAGRPDLSRLLLDRAASVHVNDSQAGTFQPDVSFRGFTGSPLLGSSEGLAVYQDGVRVNEAFGDTINWDVLPSLAVASVNLMPGSNPLFGLNTLGGAVSVRMKDGFAAPGHQAWIRGGSFGRYNVEAETGGHDGAVAYYVAGSLTREAGWRDFSPSTVRRVFGDVAWRGAASQLNVNVTGASNDLTANGPAPVALLEEDRDAVFTHPDRTDNDLFMTTVKNFRTVAIGQLDTVAYYRGTTVRTFNGDSAEAEADEGEGEGEEETGYDALNNRSRTRTHATGATVQLFVRPAQWRSNNLLAVGGGFDTAATRFDFGSELATLTPDRGTIGSGLFDDDETVALESRTSTASLFVTDVWSIGRVSLTGSARVNWTAVRLRDQIGSALNGDHTFARVNPAGGVTVQLRRDLNLYGSYTQSSRVPTPVELTCADPEDPCRLPNAFVSDPPLEQIVAATWEAGMRWGRGRVNLTTSAYSTTAADDIIFVSSGTLRGEGHFENIERTIRRGVEASINYDVRDRLSAFATYTLQKATFGTDLVVASQFHPLAEGAEIPVAEGSTLPGVPTHTAKFGVAGTITRDLHLAVTVRAQSGQYVRGDEGNLLPAMPGFAVADVQARHRLTDRVAVVGELRNLFDARYHTFGVLGDASLIDDDLEHERFYSPGPPRGAWLGLEVKF